MKLRIKILFLLVTVLVTLLSAAYLFCMLQGNAIITKKLEALTHRKVTMSHFNVTLPFNIEIFNLNIEGLGKADKLFISPSALYFLTRNIALNNVSIIRPQITYERICSQTAESPFKTASIRENKNRPVSLIIKHLNIKEGKIDFTDRTVTPEGIKIIVKDIDFSLNNIYAFPLSMITSFELKGRIPWEQGKEEGKIEVQGWFNFYKKDMQATLKIKDIDGIYLYPYYSHWVDLEKARIESGDLNFTSQINGLNNNILAECRLELSDIVRKARPASQPQEKAERIADRVLDAFKDPGEESMALDFTVKTKMDRPEFGFSNIQTAVENKLLAKARNGEGLNPQEILKLPTKLIEGTVKGAADISKAVIEGTFAVGKEFKNALADSFRREPKE